MERLSFLSLKVPLALLSLSLVDLGAADTNTRHAYGGDGVQPLSKIAIHRAVYELHDNASVTAKPVVLGSKVCNMSLVVSN